MRVRCMKKSSEFESLEFDEYFVWLVMLLLLITETVQEMYQ